MFYRNPVFYVFVAGMTAFILMILTTCSVPLVSSLYFLYTTEARGVRFGLWGWCLDDYDLCSGPWQLGYTWEPQIPNPITKALVLYPITAVFNFLTMISLIPMMYTRTTRADRVFVILAWISFTFSTFAFSFMIGMWGVAKYRFEKRGFSASYGPLPWLSLTATLLLLAVALSPFIIGPPPMVQPQKNLRRRLRRVKNFQQLEASHRKHQPQQSRQINIKSPS